MFTNLNIYLKNLNQFCDRFGFYQIRKTNEAIALCRQYKKELSHDEINEIKKQTLEDKFQKALFAIVCSLNIYHNAPAKLGEAEVNDYEAQICELLKKENFDESRLNDLVVKRMPSHQQIDGFLDELGLSQPLIKIDSTPFREVLPELVMVSSPKPREIKLSEKPLTLIEKIFDQWRYRTKKPLRYRDLLEHWKPIFQRDDLYFSQLANFQRYEKPFKQMMTNYLGDKLAIFFVRHDGFCDIAHHFLSLLEIAGIEFFHQGISQIQQQLLELDRKPHDRLSIQQLLTYQQWIIQNGSHELKNRFSQMRYDWVQNQLKQQENICLIETADSVIVVPDPIHKLCSIPYKKPSFLRGDRRRKHDMAQAMTAGWCILKATQTRIQGLTQEASQSDFNFDQALEILQKVMDELQFLKKQYQFLTLKILKRKFLHRLFYRSSRQLSFLYQAELLRRMQAYQKQLLEVLKIVLERFGYWINTSDQRLLSANQLKNFDVQLRSRAVYIQQYVQAQNKQTQQFNHALPNKLKSFCAISESPISITKFCSSSWTHILSVIEARESTIVDVPEIELIEKEIDEAVEQENLENSKLQYLKKLSKGELLTNEMLGLLCANTIENTEELLIERQNLHDLLFAKTKTILRKIRRRKNLIAEELTYLEQIIQYFQSMNANRLLAIVSKKLIKTILACSDSYLESVNQALSALQRKMNLRNSDYQNTYWIKRFRKEQQNQTKQAEQTRFILFQTRDQETNPLIKLYIDEAYQKMIANHWTSCSKHRHQLQDIAAVENFMCKRLSDFEQLIEKLEIAVAAALNAEKTTRQLAVFEHAVSQGVCFDGALASWVKNQFSAVYETSNRHAMAVR